MNWEAVGIILAFCLVLGIILYIPGYFWAKWKIKKSPGHGKIIVTKYGFIFYGVMVFILMVGISAEHWASETGFGSFLASGIGKVVFLLGLFFISGFIEKLLKKYGFDTLKRVE